MNLRIVVLIVSIFVGVVAWADDSPRVSLRDYNKVAIGSDLPFVHQCLGKHTSISFHDGVLKTLKWETKDATIVVRFKSNRVVEKWHSALDIAD
jgi:hypothetical protein